MHTQEFIARVTEMATAVGGTEAAAFMVPTASDLRLIVHIRPDNTPDTVRQRAVDAFREIISPCVFTGKDGVVRVSDDASGNPQQFCIVPLIRNAHGVLGAVAIIVRCPSQDDATRLLRIARTVADGNGPGPSQP